MHHFHDPNHPIPDYIAFGFKKINENIWTETQKDHNLAQLARFNSEEREIVAHARQAALGRETIDQEALQRLRDLRKGKFNRVESAFREPAAPTMPLRPRPVDPSPPVETNPPVPTDSTFWYASSSLYHPNNFWHRLEKDGFHFFGGVHTHDGDLHNNTFGVIALFELQDERIPQSPSHRWVSAPHVEIFGKVTGYTGDDDLASGDLWSKCWLNLDQRIYQWSFAQQGSEPVVLGQAHSVDTLIFEENADRSVTVPLPGFQFMPTVAFTGVAPSSSIWARLEIQFHVQTEGAGTLVMLNPETLIRTFQWPLSAL